MIKALKIVVVAAFLFLLAAIYVLFFRKGEARVLDKTPMTATSVMVIDVRGLSYKLLFDDLGRGSKTIGKLLPDSLRDIDWSANGLGLPDKIALFTLEDSVDIHAIVPISNAKKFNLFINTIGQRLHSTVAQKGNSKWLFIQNLGLLMAWNDQFVTCVVTRQNTDKHLGQLIGVLSTKKSQSILADTCFTNKLSAKYDVLLYSRPYQECPVKMLKIIHSNMVYCTSLLNFNKGELEIITDLKAKEASVLDKAFIPLGEEMPCLANTKSSMVNLCLQMDPEASMKLYHQYKPFDFKPGIPYSKVWNGRINLALLGNKTIENEFTTYEYDDNFNKVAVKTRKQEKTLDIQAIVGIDKIKNDSIAPVKNGLDTLLFAGGNFVMRKAGSYVLIYNKLFTKPAIAPKTTKNNIELEIDYHRLSPILKDLGITGKMEWLDSIGCEKVTCTAYKKGTIHVTSRIFFSDKKTNSLKIISNLNHH